MSTSLAGPAGIRVERDRVGRDTDPPPVPVVTHRVVTTAGRPAVSLVLVLQGVPAPDEVDIVDRVRQGSLSLQVELDFPAGAGPDFVRDGQASLLAEDGRVLCRQQFSGASSAVALACELDQRDALAVLAALHGQGEQLHLESTYRWRAETGPTTVSLSGNWAAIHDLIPRAELESDHSAALRPIYEAAMAAGVLQVRRAEPAAPAEPAGPEDLAEQAWPPFAASARPVLLTSDGRWAPRPSPYFDLELTVRANSTGREQQATATTALRDVLGDVLAGQETASVIRLVSITATQAESGSGTTEPSGGGAATPRRVRSAPATRGAPLAAPGLVVGRDGAVRTTRAAVQLAALDRGNLTAALANNHARPFTLGVHAIALDDGFRLQPVPADLPVVTDPAAWQFPGRLGAQGWYAPSFSVVMPAANTDAGAGSFVFSFRRAGVTASGQPGLDAQLTMRLRPEVPAEVAAAIAAGANLRTIPVANAEVALDLPFRDQGGTNQRQRFPAEVTWDGDTLVAEVALIDAWARLAYGALSQPGFQFEPARVAVTWSFAGLVEERDPPIVFWGGKQAILPIRFAEVVRSPDPGVDPDPEFFDARTATLHNSAGEFRLRAAAPGQRKPRGGPSLILNTQLVTGKLNPKLTGLRPRPGVDPDLPIGGVDPPRRPPPTWAQRSYLRSQVLELMVPCNQFGACYVEQRPEGLVAIGCQDALRLGQTQWRQYEELTELADPAFRVFRSLQQPGRFVLLPTRLVVGRYPPEHPSTPFAPAILLYALLDPDNPANNQVAVQASLIDDVAPYARARLGARLRRYAANPVLVDVTEIEATPSFTWTVLGIPSVSVPAVLGPGGVQVSVQCDLAHALLLRDMLDRDGLAGSLTLKLPDGATMTTSLLIALSALAGPEPTGPITLAGTAQVTLANRTERRVDVAALLVDQGGTTCTQIDVDTTLAPGASVTVDARPALGASDLDLARCWPAYTVPPAPPAELSEIRSFVEDITMNVVFVDLIDHPTHQVAHLDLRAQLVDASAVQPVALAGAPASGSATFVLPLTGFLSSRVVRFQVTVTHTAGTTADSAWLDWDVATRGALISLTWPLLGFA